MTSFIAELRRRNVLKVAAAYAVVAWILIESGSVLLPTFGAPEWFFRVYVLIVAAGFVLALMFAWIFELTPEGVKLEKDVDRSASTSDQTGRRLNYGIIGLLAVALAISVSLNVSGLRGGEKRSMATAGGASIAVLPFTSRSSDPENELFTDGIHDDLLTSLANVQALKVISRTSVLEYRNTAKNLREIAAELGVDNVLEGSVQRAGSNVRINVQLIDAHTDEHLWAKIYDRELTAKNIFKIQSEISSEITTALRAQLTPAEQDRLVSIPTEDIAAYTLYLAGRNNLNQRQLETVKQAREQFQQAIDLDPDYSQAYSGLADSVMLLAINHQAIPRSEAHRLAQEALDKALALDDQNADAYASLGLLKLDEIRQDVTSGSGAAEAEVAFRKAIELSPNHAQTYAWFAGLKNTQGDREGAAELYRKALDLDPLSRISRSNLGSVYAQLGRNDEALAEWLEAIRINPGWPVGYDSIANHLAGQGRLDEAYAWSVRARELSTDPLSGQAVFGVLLQFRQEDRANELLGEMPRTHPLFPLIAGFQQMFAGNYREALNQWAFVRESGSDISAFILDPVSDAALLAGDHEMSMEFCLRQHPRLADPGFKIDVTNAHNVLKYAYLLLLEDADSARGADLLDELLSVIAVTPRFGLAGHGIRDVQVLALQGKTEAALARLRQAFEGGFRGTLLFDNWSIYEDPYLESIRDTDEFRAVTADIEAANAVMRERVDKARASGNFEPLRAVTKRNASERESV